MGRGKKSGKARCMAAALLVIFLILFQTGNALASGYSTRMAAVNEATRHLGEPYVWGSGWPPGFDCSGYVNYIMMLAGVGGFYSGPYLHGPTADIQAVSFSYAIDVNRLAPGDLLFLDRTYDANYDGVLNYLDTWTHVGVYEGNGYILQAGGGGVSRRKLTDWTSIGYNAYKVSFAGARRVKSSLWPGGDSSFNEKEGIKYLAGDFNGDKKEDVVAFQDYTRAATAIWSYITRASGSIGSPYSSISMDASLSWLSANWTFDWKRATPVSVDFDGDGKTDLLVLYDYGGSHTGIFFFKSTGSGFSISKVFESYYWNASSTKLVAGDFDADGKQEVLAFYDYGQARTGVFLFKLNASGQFDYPQRIFYSPYWDWKNTTVFAGKNADSRDNVLAAYNYGGTNTGLWLFSFNDNGNLIYPSRIFFSPYWDYNSTAFTMADLNDDRLDDVVAFYRYGPTKTGALVFTSTATSFNYPYMAWYSDQWDMTRTTFLPGDFDGDGNVEYPGVYANVGTMGQYINLPKDLTLSLYGRIWFSP